MLWPKVQFLYAPDGSGGSGGGDPEPVQTSLPPSPPPADPGEWEKKYKGLQTVVNKLNGEKEKLAADLAAANAKIEELNVKITGLEGQTTKLNGDLDAEKKNSQTAQTNASAKDVEIMRLRLLIKDYIDLAPFEVAGSLPAATTEEETRAKFEAFKSALTSVIKTGVQDKLAGASVPVSSSKPVEPTIDSLYEQMVRIAGKPGKAEEYRALQAQYDQLLAKK